MTKKQKKALLRILLGGGLLLTCALLPLTGAVRFGAFMLPYLLIGGDVLLRAGRNILRGQVFDENFLMSLATLGAIAIGDYSEAVVVMLFYQVGELFQSYAVGRSRQSIAKLMDIRPDYANIEREGAILRVDPEEVQLGDTILIKAGERIPLDGRVLTGQSSLNTAALTGESLPRDVGPGDEVISGCVNLSGVLRLTVTRVFAESTVSKILDLVENASSKKARAENFITRFARVYTPAVVIAAVLLAIMPPLLVGGEWAVWLGRALTFLVISCPCALVISVPLSFFGGIGGASKSGILIKGSNYLETLAKVDTVVFDKTGTLTKGVFNVTAIHPEAVSEQRLLELAALAESFSDHPISRSLREAYHKPMDQNRVKDAQELSGRGVQAMVDQQAVWAGNAKLMAQAGVTAADCHLTGTIVHVAVDGTYCGHIVISDAVKPDAAAAIRGLKAMGIQKTVMLTGDAAAVAEAVAKELSVDEVHAGLLPADKVSKMESLLSVRARGTGTLAFVGDGINDAPVLTRADIGIAMGALGSDAAIEAADVVLMDDQPGKLCTAIRLAKRTMAIVKQNIAFALCVKFLVLVLGALGFANMWAAVFADVGVSVIAILNAMRALRREK